jgi:GGDEF domain-containing protein
MVARLGGDELIILLPETDEEAARKAIEKLRGSLLREMADSLMYSVKNDRKNAVRFSVCTD